jgi:hypothetical protein
VCVERSFDRTAPDPPYPQVQSINLWGCLVLPPLVGAATSRLETFRVMLPGLWLMAASPLALVLLPDVAGACLWQARNNKNRARPRARARARSFA